MRHVTSEHSLAVYLCCHILFFSARTAFNKPPTAQQKWLPMAPSVCSLCVCLFTTHCCVCTWMGEMQSTNYSGRPYLATRNVLSFSYVNYCHFAVYQRKLTLSTTDWELLCSCVDACVWTGPKMSHFCEEYVKVSSFDIKCWLFSHQTSFSQPFLI